jgi:charged multivesicular body protein 3
VKKEVKSLALKGQTQNAKILAKEIVLSNKQKQRLHTSKARLNSIDMQLKHQLGE